MSTGERGDGRRGGEREKSEERGGEGVEGEEGGEAGEAGKGGKGGEGGEGGEGHAAGARTYLKVRKRGKQSKERGEGGDVGVGRHIRIRMVALARRLQALHPTASPTHQGCQHLVHPYTAIVFLPRVSRVRRKHP